MNLKQLREDNSDEGLGLSPETIDELINYCEWLVYYYEKPHKFEAGKCPSVCGKCGRNQELHDQPQLSKASLPQPWLNLPCGCTIEQGDSMKSSVFWNELNRVVQCHKCGQVYEPASPLGERSGDQPSPAAEREKLRQANESADGWRDQCSDLCEQLAAERQRREQVEQELWTMRAGDKVKDDQLRAERQRRDSEEHASEIAYGILLDEINGLNQRLLSALAAIEKHNKSLSHANKIAYEIDVDLSALRKHDAERTSNVWKACEQYVAEVRKPLVELLNDVRVFLTRYRNGVVEHAEANTLASRIDALANVKP